MSYRLKWDLLIEIFGDMCVYCHRQPATQIDHVVPVSCIECHKIENLRPCCSWCNLLAGSLVFETFEEKYEYLREARAKKEKFRHKRTVCTVCWLPYQRPLHSPSLFLCAECNDSEYGTGLAGRPAWREWLHLLADAGINVDCHREFGGMMRALPNTTVGMPKKRTIFGRLYAGYLEDDEDSLSYVPPLD